MRSVWIIGIVVLAGLVAAPAALAGWFWNSAWEVGGQEVHLCWSVDDGSGPDAYRANVELAYPKGVDVDLEDKDSKVEQVHKVASKKLSVVGGAAQIRATFRVDPVKGTGSEGTVSAWVTQGSSCGTPAIGGPVTGSVREKLVVNASVTNIEIDDEEEDDD
ncbi:MAG: hypothetical protein HYY01_14470 [Chloroflexi bacterium]|nr:hypothetical protein [Chloroflexota bacterium]